MRKNLMKLATLAGIALVGQLAATDFRAPIATQMGPLHYSFDKLHKKKSNFTYFTTGHFRETDEAYIKHGTSTHPLSQLIFGKPEFYVSEAFQDGKTYEFGYTENYNPHLKTTKLAPRVSYSEMGVFFGASWDYPVWHNKGRIGIRGSLPIRWVRMERDDQEEAKALGEQGDVIKGEIRYVNPFKGSDNTSGVIQNISSYRLELLRGLLYVTKTGNVFSAFQPLSPNGANVANATYGVDAANVQTYGNTNPGHKIPFVVIKAAHAGQPTYGQGGALLVENTKDPVDVETGTTKVVYPSSDVVDLANVALLNVAADGSGPDGANKAAAFTSDTSYGNLFDNDGAKDLWATSIHGLNGDPIAMSNSGVAFVDNLLLYYRDDVEQWLRDRGFMMATDEETSIGDIPVEVFYEHSFNDNWRGELCLGVKFPTGNGGSDYTGNPYRVQMGNADHWEIKLGGLIAWQALRCMNVKLDLSYNFALEETEQRCAVYKGSTIKNFGPRADADVDWGYFVGNLDFNFTHPKSKKIMGMIGYQLYYKTEDHIDFKDKNQTTWLGKVWTDANGKKADATTQGIKWTDLEMDLDGGLARKNTEAWGHRIRLEGTYKLSKYCVTSVGGLYTFAGQNIPAEADVHCACKINF